MKVKEIKSVKYERPAIKKGYANHVLHVNLSSSDIYIGEVLEDTKKLFIGGKGFNLWLLWNSVGSTTKWDDPENAVCIASGPLGGTPIYPGSGKSIVCAISPTTGSVIDSNVGGYFGPYLKFAGFDAMEIHGKAKNDTVIFIDGIDSKIEIYEFSGLPKESHRISEKLTKYFGGDNPRSISVVSTGRGAKNTLIGCLNFSWYDSKRKKVRCKQAGRGGMGTVFADKGIKAIVVRWDGVTVKTNNPANEEALKEVGREHSREISELDKKQNEMAVVGTGHLVTIMNDYDLLPVKNYRYGSHPEAPNIGAQIWRQMFDKGFDGCWMGCTVSCAHCVKDFVPLTGPYRGKKVLVDGPEYETIAALGSNIGVFDAHTVVELNFYCDTYGLDTISAGTCIAFAMECFELGLINKKHTSGMDLSFGNRWSALKLIHQMAEGKGFGVIIGQGIRKMKKIFADKFGADPKILQDIGMEAKGLEFSEYMTKESLAQQGGYGLALKGPQHDEAWLIFEDMVRGNLPTFEKKAEALYWFPMWRIWFSLNGLCKLPWNDIVPEDNKEMPEPAKVMKHVQWYAKYFSAVTGRESTPEDLIKMSEPVYNFQRIFCLRMGFGTREHDDIPYRAVGPVTKEEYESRSERYDKQLVEKYNVDISAKTTEEKMALLRKYREGEYEKLKDAVYKRRGWTRNGIPTLETVKRLGIDFPQVVKLLKQHGVEE